MAIRSGALPCGDFAHRRMRVGMLMALAAVLGSPCLAQTTVSEDQVTLLAAASGSASIPANTVAVDVAFPLEEAASGGGEIVISTEIPEIGISLVLPNGVEITQTNATSLGGLYERNDLRDPNAPAVVLAGAVVTRIVLFPGAGPGIAKIRASSTGVATATSLTYLYRPSAGMRIGLAPGALVYRPNSVVRLSAFLFGPTGAALTAVNASVNLHRTVTLTPAEMSATSLTFVNRQAQTNGYDVVRYRANVVSTRPTTTPATLGTCSIVSTAVETVEPVDCNAFLRTVAPNATVVSEPLSFRVPTGQSVSMSQLQWTFESTGAPVTIPMTDTTAWEPVAGNGTFVGEALGLAEGTYIAILNATNSSPVVPAFSRTATATFRVLGAAATLQTAQSQLVDTNANGSPDLLRVNFSVSVPAAGNYALRGQLLAANSQMYQLNQRVTLTAGTQTISADVLASELVAMGASGPLSIRNIALDLETTHETLLQHEMSDMGQTVPVSLTALDRGAVYVTGMASATGIANGQPGFELLRVSLNAVTPATQCFWRGELSAPDGTFLALATASGSLATAGPKTLGLDFDGGAIRRAAKDGPYKVDKITMECLTYSGTYQAETPYQTGAFTATQFENVAPSFLLTAEAPSISVPAGESAVISLGLSAIGTFDAGVTVSVAGLPASVTSSGLTGPIQPPASTALDLVTAAGTAPGTYPLTFTATGGGVTRTATVNLLVTATAIAVQVSPAYIWMNRNETQQFTANVVGAPTNAVVWSVDPPVGTISASGLYTAPASLAATQPVNIQARSVHDLGRMGQAPVTLVASPVAIALDPPSATMLPGQVLALTATVQNTANQTVNWTLSPSVGSITPAGVYTAPATIASIQTVTITATSAADPAKAAVATITLKPAFTPIRINAAASNYTDSEGRLWQADTGFTGGGGSLGGGIVRGTYDPSLYLSARTGTFSYDFTVPPGNYAVTLRFAETNIFAGPGFRRFNVAINNVPVEQNLDVFAAAGGGLRALDRTYPQMASGPLSIQFSPGAAQVPMVSAIEIAAAPTSPAQIAVTPANAILVPGETRQFTATVTGATNPRIMWTLTPAVGSISTSGLYTAPATMTSSTEVKIRAVSVEDGLKYGESSVVVGPAEFSPIRLRAGSTAAYTDTAGQVWSADTRYRGGSPGFTWTAAAGAPDPNVYQHWRQDHFRYDFFGPAGSYLVKLRFREPGIFAGPGSRRFPIFVNDTAIEPLPGFDIFTAAGGTNKAVDRQYWVPAPQGKLGIRFDYVGNDAAMVSAIEVTDGYSIAGRVTVNGAGLPNTTISLTGAEARTTFTDADGYYRFRALRPGADYIVTASRLLYTVTSGPVNITNLQANQTANFTAMLASANLTPAFVSFTAAPTSGWFSTWTANFSDANHANDIVQGELHWGFNPGSPDRACHVRWNLITGEASLRADSGAWLPAIDMYNPQGSRSNSTCTIHTPFSNSAVANQRGFSIGVSFANRLAGEGYPISVKATDLSGASTGWVPAGGWALPQQP